MLFVPSKVKHRVADHYVCEPIRKRHLFNESDLEVLRWQSGPKRIRELANVLNTVDIFIHCIYFAPLAQQMDQVSSVSTTGVEDAHACDDVSSQNLIKYVNINLPELFLNI